jgi:hypothetical protein
MRYLHAISPVESFIASGSYHDGLHVSQKWTIHQLPDQAWMIRIDHIRQNILIEAWRSPERKIERIDFRTLNPPAHRINTTLENGLIEYGHRTGNDQRIQQTLDLPHPLLVLPSVIGISLALDEWHATAPSLVTIDLPALDLITFQMSVTEWQKPVDSFAPNGIPQRYHDPSGAILTLTDFAAHRSFHLSTKRESS